MENIEKLSSRKWKKICPRCKCDLPSNRTSCHNCGEKEVGVFGSVDSS